jgi:hypothetical protein
MDFLKVVEYFPINCKILITSPVEELKITLTFYLPCAIQII